MFNSSENFYSFLRDYEKLFNLTRKLDLQMNDIMAKYLFTADDFAATMVKNKYTEIFNRYVIVVEDEKEVKIETEDKQEDSDSE